MDTLVLLISYRWWIHLPTKQLAIHLSRGAKVVRDEADKDADVKMCRAIINCVSDREYELALESLRVGEIWHKVMG